MKTLFVLNDPPYGTERVYNALRLTQALLKKEPQQCMDARGLDDAALLAGARRSTMDELATVTADADKVLVF